MSSNIKTEKIPAYVMVYNQLYSALINGKYEDKSIFPSEQELVKEYEVSRSTLRQALAILNEDGLIIKSQGKGTIVNLNTNNQAQLNSKNNPCLNLATKKVIVLNSSYNYGVPTEIARDKLNLSFSEVVFALKSTYGLDSEVFSYCFLQVPVKVFKWFSIDVSDENLIIDEFSKELLFEKATNVEYTIKSIVVNESDADILDIELGSVVTLIEGLFYIGNDPFARAKYYLNPDKHIIKMNF